jgi:hypothetical protein
MFFQAPINLNANKGHKQLSSYRNYSNSSLAESQMIQDILLKARTQLIYAMHPCTPDFLLFRPDSTYTVEDAGQLPWGLKQLETVLSAHSSQVASYLRALAPEVLSICCGVDVRSALIGKKTEALLPSDNMDEVLVGLLTRCSLNLRAVCREMVLESADVFASHIESFCPQLIEERSGGIKVCVNSAVVHKISLVLCSPSLQSKANPSRSFGQIQHPIS